MPRNLIIFTICFKNWECINTNNRETASQGGSNFSKETPHWRNPLPLPQYCPEDCSNTTSVSVSGITWQETSSPPMRVLQQKVRVSVLGYLHVTLSVRPGQAACLPWKPFCPSPSQVSWQGSGMSRHELENKQKLAIPYPRPPLLSAQVCIFIAYTARKK